MPEVQNPCVEISMFTIRQSFNELYDRVLRMQKGDVVTAGDEHFTFEVRVLFQPENAARVYCVSLGYDAKQLENHDVSGAENVFLLLAILRGRFEKPPLPESMVAVLDALRKSS